MKRTMLGRWATALALGVVTAVGATTARAQDSTQITLVQGLPTGAVDVNAGGNLIVANFNPGSIADLTQRAGDALQNVAVVSAGTDDVVLGPIAELSLPASGNHSLVIHLDANGAAVLTSFENDVSATDGGAARLTVRHAADADAVDLVVGSERPVAGLTNGQSGQLELAAGTRDDLQLAPAGAAPIATLPMLDLAADTNTIVYVTGSADGDTLGFAVQVVDVTTGAGSGAATTTTVAGGAATTTTAPSATTSTTTSTTSTTAVAPTGVGTGFPLDDTRERTLVAVLVGGLLVAAGAALLRSRLTG